jgi:hypothetical protein
MAATITAESSHDPKRFPNLETVVGRQMYPTPDTQNHRDGKLQLDTVDRVAHHLDGPGQLNPMWVEWLMGYPVGWTDLED